MLFINDLVSLILRKIFKCRILVKTHHIKGKWI